jgi:uncharacterized protein YbjT (DUF2867 family)
MNGIGTKNKRKKTQKNNNRMKKTAILLGATGLVGGELLKILLEDKNYAKIRVFSRKAIGLDHPKIELHLIDFDKPDTYRHKVLGDEVFCCLGTTIRQAKSKANFYKVDYQYPITFAEIALQNGVRRFSLVSAMGAKANSLIYYNRVKGETENKLLQIPFEAVHILRPSLLLGERKEVRTGEIWGKKIGDWFGFLIPKKYKGIEASAVAKAMQAYVLRNTSGIWYYESDKLQEFAQK